MTRHRLAPAALMLFAPLAIPGHATAQCQVQKLLAADATVDDQLGDDVAISGHLAVIGASRHDGSGSGSGAVYVYRYDEALGVWSQEAKLTAPDAAPNDFFGWSVDVFAEGDATPVIVVGAYLDDDGAGNSGSVYVFQDVGVSSPQWVLDTKLQAPDAAAGDEFGQSVAIADGVIVAGAALANSGGLDNAGAAYVFFDDGSGWDDGTKLVAPDAMAQDRFGIAVDVTTSGAIVDVVVGAHLDDVGTVANAGSAWVFTWNGTWDAGTILEPEFPEENGKFGISVATHDSAVLVGSFLADVDGLLNAGSATVFRNDGAGWFLEATIAAADPDANDQFGSSVALVRDPVAGDIAIVGSPLDDDDGASSGSAYVFRSVGTGNWAQEAKLSTLDAAGNDKFGWSVAIGGAVEVGGTVSPWIIAGAPKDDNPGGSSAGAAYLFNGELGVCNDCNDNGILDALDIATGASFDCDGNGVPDECQIAEDSEAPGGPFYCLDGCDPDCNENGIPDSCDIAEGYSDDENGNGIPDECEDCNGNGVPDDQDILEGTSADCQGNGVPDECDIDATDSLDCNENGVPDECEIHEDTVPGGPYYCIEDCDPDCNGNGIPDECDIAAGESADCQGNGIPDDCEIADGSSEDDNDNGIPDECEDCNDNGLEDFYEIIFFPELDCNLNGLIDDCEISVDSIAPGGPFYCTTDCNPDCNDNGVPDDCDVEAGTSEDLNGNGIPDECEDCNENGILDTLDIDSGFSADCDGNQVPDECQIAAGSGAPGGPFYCLDDCDPDCNGNGIPDECDIASGTSDDCDGNGIPDDCDPDCNDNGVVDACDVDPTDPDGDGHTSPDLNDNGVPDECEPDCDNDGFPDFLEIQEFWVEDCNENGIPDPCEIDESSTAPGGPFYCEEDCATDCNNDGIPDDCQPWVPSCDCSADFDGSGTVGVPDLLSVLAQWGDCAGCPQDLDENGLVDIGDLLVVLAQWGDCP